MRFKILSYIIPYQITSEQLCLFGQFIFVVLLREGILNKYFKNWFKNLRSVTVRVDTTEDVRRSHLKQKKICLTNIDNITPIT